MQVKIIFDIPNRKGKRLIPALGRKFQQYIPSNDDEQAEIVITNESFKSDCDKVPFFWCQVQGWKSTQVYINDHLAPKQQIEDFVKCCDCYSLYGVSKFPKEHCWNDRQRPGWGCKQLCWILRYDLAYSKRTDKRWYQVGPFEKGIQYIDKDEIGEHLKREMDFKCLEMCPKFSFDRVKKAISSLPDKIDPDRDDLWEIEYFGEPGFSPKAIGVMPKIYNDNSVLNGGIRLSIDGEDLKKALDEDINEED
jgi:hypothetical protein